MADRKNDNNKINKNIEEMNVFDSISKKILSSINSNYKERSILNSKDARFQSIINREIDISKGISNGNIVDFAVSQYNSGNKKPNANSSMKDVDVDSIFTQNVGDVFQHFQEVYKNKYIEMADLKFISKFIPALGEAVKTTLDSIVASDDISSTITRTLNLPPTLEDATKNLINAEIKKIEKEEKLLTKLKNIVYKKTLVSGNYYVYAIGYNDLFMHYDKLKQMGYLDDSGMMNSQRKNTSIMKSGGTRGFNITNEGLAIENIVNPDSASTFFSSFESASIDKTTAGNIKKNLESHISTFSVIESDIPMISVIESVNSLKSYEDTFKSLDTKTMATVDGVKGVETGKTSEGDFNISGTYLKYIDPKNIIPLRIFNKVVGYHHIHVTRKKSTPINNGGMISNNSSLFNSTNLAANRKEEVINDIADSIADGIMKNFSKKFVGEHSEHKKLIADCIITNGIVDNEYMIQFIPVENIVEFTINEDENGYGESMLTDSLFPAKLLLSLIISKMLTYFNKSGNKTIAHVFKGPIDVSTSNQLDRVVRMLQDSNITFNDLLSTSLTFSKFSRDSNIQLPTARNGTKLVEFETQEGQNIDLKTDFEDKLEDMAILGTGVPSVIMDYVNQIDYAKQITSANIKFAGRISSLQADLETSTTRLYKILIQNSTLTDEVKAQCQEHFEFILPRPRALTNTNNSEFFRTVLENSQFIADTLIGANNNEPAVQKIKDILVKKITKKETPYLDWELYESLYEESQIESKTLEGEEPQGQ